LLLDSNQLLYNERVERNLVNLRWAGYLGAVLGAAVVTALLAPFHEQINSTTVALAFLLVVLFVALFWGSRPALLASVLGMFCLNFFFLPPLYTLSIAHPPNWVALTAFFTTALAVGQLSARAKRQAKEAEAGRREIERLYKELQEVFERASQAEALRQSERLKSALLDAVTHDLRTPLTSIKASITTLLDEVRRRSQEPVVALDSESRLEMMEVIDEESDRLNRFIGGLIDLARIEAGELHLRRRWGTVDEIISTALARAEPLTEGREVDISVEAELPVVRVDERAVSEVVYTLVDNAAKYSPTGTKIQISAERSDDGMIVMAVEDQGTGVGVELRDRVFDKFFRATRDGDISTHQPSGTGMGLAIARGIVEAHDGRIWIESGTGGKGTRVVFTLPIGDEDMAEPNELSTPAATENHER
jgi:two-component system sensor histidine kinase KdpD